MAKGINIGIAADARDFDRGVKSGIIEPLGDATDILDDLARAGKRAGDDLEDTLRHQQRETEDARKEYEALNREIQDGSGRSSRAMSESSDRAVRDTTEGFDEIKDSGKSNAIEVAASFDGSASSIADGFQGLAAEAFAGFGPAGLVAGAAAAAGLGLISAQLEKDKERAAQLKQAAADLAGEFIETGKIGSVSMSYIADAVKALATETEDGKDSLTSLRREAEKAGVTVKDYQLANAGAARETKKSLKEARDEYDAISQSIIENGGQASKAERSRQAALGATIGKLLEVRKTQKDAAQTAKDYQRSGAADLQAAGEAVESYSDAVQGAYASAGSDVEKYVKNGKFNLDAYEKAMADNVRAIEEYQANSARVQVILAKGGHDKALQYLEQLGPESAPLIAAFLKAPAAQQDALEQTWDKLGTAASASFGTSLQSDLDAHPATKRVVLHPDDSAIQAMLRRTFTLNVDAKVGGTAGRQGMSLGSGTRNP